MEIISNRKCYIGEGPIWNERENALYQVNAGKNEIIRVDFVDRHVDHFALDRDISSLCFTNDNQIIGVSERNVGYILNLKNSAPVFNGICSVFYGNDAKCGPDGRFYVGTQSRKRLKISDDIDGKLYQIDTNGSIRTLLDGLILSNGMDWNMREDRFYHTDSDTKTIKEYEFDKKSGDISFTGRSVYLPGVDGFTIDQNDVIWAACWGKGIVAAVDTHEMKIVDGLAVPTKIPVSCGFCGKNMEYLAITSAGLDREDASDSLAGFTFFVKMDVPGRAPYRFG